MTTPHTPTPPNSNTSPNSAIPAAQAEVGDEHLAHATILVVDDNEQNLELLLAYLEDTGAKLLTARDGVEALASVAATRPDLILLDVMMPRMSGFQVCAKLKQDPATREIPIVVVTALNEVADVERAVELGADDFLTKPVNRLELRTRVKSLVRLGLLQRKMSETLEGLKRTQRNA